ncbi:MAG: C25 family cysteine peptidase [Chitinophagales bacterium]|jgi:hypothetical protein|nr:C25 family cysteine peptidase [Chitinophagales bacterium]
MKKLSNKAITLFLWIYCLGALGQTNYGFEWIDAAKPHVKFSYRNAGVYRISIAYLQENFPGFSLSNASELTAFAFGNQIPLFLSWTNTPQNSDFIEFYLPAHTNQIDTSLYRNPALMLNPFMSLVTDSAYVYLTHRVGNNPRFTNYNNDTNATTTTIAHLKAQQLITNRSTYHEGVRTYVNETSYVFSPDYDDAEGYGFNAAVNTTLSSPSVVRFKDAYIEANYVAKARGLQKLTIRFNSTVIQDTFLPTSSLSRLRRSISGSLLNTSNTLNVTYDQNMQFLGVGYLRFSFFRLANALNNQDQMYFIDTLGHRFNIQFNSFAHNNQRTFLYNLSRMQRLSFSPLSNFKLYIDSNFGESSLYFTAENRINTLTNGRNVNFNTKLLTQEADFIVLSQPIYNQDSFGGNPLSDYVAYRNSPEGGKHQASLVYADELSELFSYGVPKHPAAYRNYITYGNLNWQKKPKNLFIISKGYAFNMPLSFPIVLNQALIPWWGNTPNDYYWTVMKGLDTQYASVGRLSALSGQTVRHYLNKVIAYEANYNNHGISGANPVNKDWLKWAAHLAGGTGNDQLTDYRAHMRFLETKLVDTPLGFRVHNTFKLYNEPLPNNLFKTLEDRINEGVGFLSFLGHSSSTLVDGGLKSAVEYNNFGKCPIMLINGCKAGSAFNFSESIGEGFINSKDKGAVSFIGNSNDAYDLSLKIFSNSFYDRMIENKVSTSVGQTLSKASGWIVKRYFSQLRSFIVYNAIETNLNGDPAIPIPIYNKPDYYIDASLLTILSQNITSEQDSFQVRLIAYNLGKAIKDSIALRINRFVGSQRIDSRLIRIKAPYNFDTFIFKLPTLVNNKGVGSNTLSLKIDDENQYEELNEQNNSIISSQSFQVLQDDIFPLQPKNFGIVNQNTITLYAYKYDVSNPKSRFRFEFDTTELFNSPLKQNATLTSTKPLLEWKPNIILKDSSVYYWRVTTDSLTPEDRINWKTSSFVFLANQPFPGWNQSHYFQFQKNDYTGIYLRPNRNFEYTQDDKLIEVKADGNWGFWFTYNNTWSMDNVLYQAYREYNIMPSGINIAWIDGKTGIQKTSTDTTINGVKWGSLNSLPFLQSLPQREGFVYIDTGKTPSNHPMPNRPWSEVILNMINEVPDGDFLIFYSLLQPKYAFWDASLKNFFFNYGFTKLDSLVQQQVQAPFVFAIKKGSFTPIHQSIGRQYGEVHRASFLLKSNWQQGGFKTPEIGPALLWKKLQVKFKSSESPNTDNVTHKLYGVTNNGTKQLLRTFTSYQIDTPIEWINLLGRFPKLQYEVNTQDAIHRTPPQIEYIRIIYESSADVAVNIAHYERKIDTLNFGQVDSFGFGIESLNEKYMQPFLVRTIIADKQANTKTFYTQANAIEGFQKTRHHVLLDKSRYFEGDNFVTYELNPLDSSSHISEDIHQNNFGKTYFFVKSIVNNPLLDVTFDQQRIVDNQLVSANPSIQIQLKDDNQFLLLDDTALMQVYLKYPNGNQVLVPYRNPQVQYNLATDVSQNYIKFVYQPKLEDGTYELYIQNKNKQNQSSSSSFRGYQYKVAFKVINKATISRVMNYPNPFSTATQFIFTLTGSKMPEDLRIQIMNIRGELVKEIKKEELGPLNLGLNRTQYAWDGKDRFGDILANGVYFYRVKVTYDQKDMTLMDNELFEQIHGQSNNLEKFFTENWGKMVILR